LRRTGRSSPSAGAQPRRVLGGGRRRHEERGRVAGREAHEDERERGDEPHECQRGREAADDGGHAREGEGHARMMPRRGRKGRGVLGVAVGISGAACAAAGACAAPPRPADTAVVASGADLESPNPVATVHPLSRQVQRHVLLVTLARYDSALRPVPYYARRWTWSADRRTLTLALEPALRWHDGVPTTAHDAVFTLALAADPRAGSPRRAEVAGIAGATAADDTTLVVRFAAPQPDVPAALCELPLVPRHLLDTVPPARLRQAAFERAPVGNGPFRFAERRPGARWTFARNAAFPPSMGGPPRLARLVVAVVDEPTTKFAGLVSGELDAAGIAPTAAALLARDPAARVLSYPVAFSTGLVFNTTRPPFDDARVRLAVDLAVDRRRVVDAALAGYGTPADGAVPPDNPLAAARPAARDPRRADALLDAAGWRRGPDGVRRRGGVMLAVELLTVGAGDNAVEQLVQADLAERGVRVAVRPQELGAFLVAARAPRKTFDLLLTGVPGDVGLSYLASLFASSSAGGALDYAGFHRPALDAAFARAAAAPTADARRRAWAAVQQVLADSVPVAWLYHARGVQGVARRLEGVTMDLRGELATVHDWRMRAPPAPR
jgi:peptide/nickel transport system substrate-binding protein